MKISEENLKAFIVVTFLRSEINFNIENENGKIFP